MKDFLETLELGDEKLKLSKEEIKSILAKHGEYIKIETDKVEDKYKNQINDNKATIDDLKSQIEKAPKSDEMENLKAKIAEYETKEADRIAKEQQAIKNQNLENNINAVLGDKKFTSKYARDGFVNDIKSELAKPENEGKGISEIIDYLSKDQTGIFESPNKAQDMPGVDNVDTDVSKEDFNKMGYKERLQLKNDNPELFAKLNN